jgi:sulfur-oxidizing protein SoxB
VCDNLFNPDPYLQQGGDMVRVGGLNFKCAPLAASGKRISELTMADGSRLDSGKSYKIAGWATVGQQSPGAPVWDVVADYLRAKKSIRLDQINQPALEGVQHNQGLADYT